MHHEFFGLGEPPFKITPNTGFFFAGGERGAVLSALIYAVTRGEGIVKLTGEVGSGKTMLCRMLEARLPERIETVYLANPSVSPEEVLHAIAFELQLDIESGAGRLEVMRRLHDHLLQRHAQNRQVVIFVEESQSMPPATLEEIRLLSNLETERHKLVQIVLFGQPELDCLLRQPHMRQLRERISHSFSLQPLDAAGTWEYLAFRLRAAGYRGTGLFDKKTAVRIARATGGLIRRVNLVADKTLLAAFADNTHAIKLRHVKAAVADSEFRPHSAISPRAAWAAGALLVAGALGTAWHGFVVPATEAENPPVSGPAPVAAIAAAAPAYESAEPPAVAAAEPPPTLLQQRLAASRELLAAQHGERFSIQLFVGDDAQPARLERFLARADKAIGMSGIYVFPVRFDGQGKFWVTYGDYASREETEAALEKLPEKYRASFRLEPKSLAEIRRRGVIQFN